MGTSTIPTTRLHTRCQGGHRKLNRSASPLPAVSSWQVARWSSRTPTAPPLPGRWLPRFLRHKARAPAIIAKYFDTAVGVCVEALHPRDFEQERALGEAREAAQSQRTGLSEELIRAIVEAAPTPTHHRFSSTFMRLYFDRILAAAAGTLGVAALAPFSRGGAASVAALSWAYLAYSSCSAGSRYADLPPLRLRDAALDLAKLTKASLVVFGHTHEEDESGPYINLGSFAFSRLDARPYLVIYSNGSHRPAVTRRLLRIAR